jgi:hypothetical protein
MILGWFWVAGMGKHFHVPWLWFRSLRDAGQELDGCCVEVRKMIVRQLPEVSVRIVARVDTRLRWVDPTGPGPTGKPNPSLHRCRTFCLLKQEVAQRLQRQSPEKAFHGDVVPVRDTLQSINEVILISDLAPDELTYNRQVLVESCSFVFPYNVR